MRNILSAFVFAVVGSLCAFPAQAALNAVGPVHPEHGFPIYYQDFSGLGLAPCLDLPVAGFAPCLTTAAPEPGVFDPANPVVFPTNFPSELFYWTGAPDTTGTAADNYVRVIEFALEGAFASASGNPEPGQQIVFTRHRFRFTPPNLNASYTIEHPFGVTTFNPPYDGGVVNVTEDIGVAAGIFTGALNGGVGPFPKWDASLPAPPAGYIGDPAIAHAITGTDRNFVRIVGPDAGGPGVNSLTLSNFLISGKVFDGALPTALTVHRANLVRTASSGRIDIFANSQANAALRAAAGPSFPAGDQILTGDASGQFFKSVALGSPTTVPATVGVTASAAGNTDVTIFKSVTDKIDVTEANYDIAAKTLTVKASTSDAGSVSPTLTVQGLTPGSMTVVGGVGSLTATNLDVPPNTVTVTSSLGGSATREVSVVQGAAVPSGPSITSTAVTTATVALPYSYQVTATDASAGTLSYSLTTAPAGMTINATTGLISWTPTSAQTGPQSVVVRVANGATALTATQSYSVTVTAPQPAEVINVSLAQYRTLTRELRVTGTSTRPNQTVTLYWGTSATAANQIGTATVDALGAFSFRQADLARPTGVTRITVKSANNTTATFNLSVRL